MSFSLRHDTVHVHTAAPLPLRNTIHIYKWSCTQTKTQNVTLYYEQSFKSKEKNHEEKGRVKQQGNVLTRQATAESWKLLIMHKGQKVDTAVVYTYDDHRSIITYEGSCKHKCKKKDLDHDFQKPCEYTPRPGNEIIVSFQEAKTARELSVENEADP